MPESLKTPVFDEAAQLDFELMSVQSMPSGRRKVLSGQVLDLELKGLLLLLRDLSLGATT